ncbi:hypothetical protein AB1Y20_010269 [Prymnesium parvum]|uniref:Uncharacterized protein n=1 Tax=Prymnesium parvum TaxID=97485 RepID=A0AB34K6W7_PRYPA
MALGRVLLLLCWSSTGLKPSPQSLRSAMRKMGRAIDTSSELGLRPADEPPQSLANVSASPRGGVHLPLKEQLEAATRRYDRRAVSPPAKPPARRRGGSAREGRGAPSAAERAANWLVRKYEAIQNRTEGGVSRREEA